MPDDRTRKHTRRRIAVSTFAVVAMGSFLHFAWEWSGRNPLVAVFAAVDESTWEHLKMAFWPALLIAPVQYQAYGRPSGWMPATVVRALLPSLMIVVLFYGYTFLLGRNILLLDIGTFVIAVLIGESAGHGIMSLEASGRLRVVSGVVLVLSTAAFSALSFAPPSFFLFQEPDADTSADSAVHSARRAAPSRGTCPQLGRRRNTRG